MPYVLAPVVPLDSFDITAALGVSLNFQVPELFQPIYSSQQQALNNLKNLLLTKIGERVSLPTYGSNLALIIFEPNLNDLKDRIKDLINRPVAQWLPYIDILDIIITTNEDNPDLQNTIEIQIIFSVNETESQLNINVSPNGTITTNT